jgi:hypothetical protein
VFERNFKGHGPPSPAVNESRSAAEELRGILGVDGKIRQPGSVRQVSVGRLSLGPQALIPNAEIMAAGQDLAGYHNPSEREAQVAGRDFVFVCRVCRGVWH